MSRVIYRLGVFATVCAAVGAYLFLIDLGETPWVFENSRPEMAFIVPLGVWLVSGRLYLGMTPLLTVPAHASHTGTFTVQDGRGFAALQGRAFDRLGI